MSFTDEIVKELAEAELHKTCCRKAMLYGLFINGNSEEGNVVSTSLKNEDVVNKATEILKKQFSAETEIKPSVCAGRKTFVLSVKSKALAGFLKQLNGDGEQGISLLVNFKCPECFNAFLRGVFVACGSVNDPRKGYHMEFSLVNERTAVRMIELLTKSMEEAPKTVKRGGRTGVYYKRNTTITDILYYMGAPKISFDITNIYIERNISNIENRATNCVTKNIEKSVAACRRQLEAITVLEKSGRLASLGADICYTAELRMKYPSVPLAELARLHEPPISKSGLNSRLSKIIDEADALEKENK